MTLNIFISKIQDGSMKSIPDYIINRLNEKRRLLFS
jgi:hypothetical protein